MRRMLSLSIANQEAGSIELPLLLLFVFMLHGLFYAVIQSMATRVSEAYQGLSITAADLASQVEFHAFAEAWPAPQARVDYAANHRHQKDAEALCYIVSQFGCATAGKNFQCN